MTPSRKEKREPWDVLPFKLPVAMLEALKLEAVEKHTSVGEVLRDIVTRYFRGELPTDEEIEREKNKPWYLT